MKELFAGLGLIIASALLIYGFWSFGILATLSITVTAVLVFATGAAGVVSIYCATVTFLGEETNEVSFRWDGIVTALASSVFFLVVMFVLGLLAGAWTLFLGDKNIAYELGFACSAALNAFWVPYFSAYVASLGISGISIARDAIKY